MATLSSLRDWLSGETHQGSGRMLRKSLGDFAEAILAVAIRMDPVLRSE